MAAKLKVKWLPFSVLTATANIHLKHECWPNWQVDYITMGGWHTGQIEVLDEVPGVADGSSLLCLKDTAQDTQSSLLGTNWPVLWHKDTYIESFPCLVPSQIPCSLWVKCQLDILKFCITLTVMSETPVSHNVIMEYLLSPGARDYN